MDVRAITYARLRVCRLRSPYYLSDWSLYLHACVSNASDVFVSEP